MHETQSTSQTTASGALRVLVPGAAATFVLAAVLHLGVPLPLGVLTLREPRIVPATIVEGLAGIVLALSSYAQLTGKPWARQATAGALGFATAGVLLGMAALAVGAGPSTALNTVYHRVMLMILVVGLLLVAAPGSQGIRVRDGRKELDDEPDI
jgi:hypothetical protein